MQERRRLLLGLIDKNLIPSSAIQLTRSNANGTYNTLYFPITFLAYTSRWDFTDFFNHTKAGVILKTNDLSDSDFSYIARTLYVFINDTLGSSYFYTSDTTSSWRDGNVIIGYIYTSGTPDILNIYDSYYGIMLWNGDTLRYTPFPGVEVTSDGESALNYGGSLGGKELTHYFYEQGIRENLLGYVKIKIKAKGTIKNGDGVDRLYDTSFQIVDYSNIDGVTYNRDGDTCDNPPVYVDNE